MTATITVEPDRTTEWEDRNGRGVARRASSTRPAATTVRVTPVPRSEPPTDDELGAAGLAAPPMAALLLPLDLATGAQVRRNRSGDRGHGTVGTLEDPEPGRRPGAVSAGGRRAIGSAGRPSGSSGPAAPGRSAGSDSRDAPSGGEPRPVARGTSSPDRTGPAPGGDTASGGDVAELRTATRLLLATCVEVVGGYRPLGQLRPLCLADRFDAIVNRLLRPGGCALGRGHGATRTSVVAGHGSPPRAGRAAQIGPGDRVALRRVQVCDVIDGIAEIAVVMSRRDKVWAMALRLEQVGGRWLCTHLEVV